MTQREDLVLENQQQASTKDAEQLKHVTETEPRTEAPAQPSSASAAKEEPSGYRGDNPSTAGPGQTDVNSNTPESKLGHLNPSAPEDSNVTPGSTIEK